MKYSSTPVPNYIPFIPNCTYSILCFTFQTPLKKLSIIFFCTFVVGRVHVSSDPLNITEDDILQLAQPLSLGGSWQPPNCLSRHIVGIVIPYRDRKSHLLQLLYYLHPMLKRQQLNYKIFVVEQVSTTWCWNS